MSFDPARLNLCVFRPTIQFQGNRREDKFNGRSVFTHNKINSIFAITPKFLILANYKLYLMSFIILKRSLDKENTIESERIIQLLKNSKLDHIENQIRE